MALKLTDKLCNFEAIGGPLILRPLFSQACKRRGRQTTIDLNPRCLALSGMSCSNPLPPAHATYFGKGHRFQLSKMWTIGRGTVHY